MKKLTHINLLSILVVFCFFCCEKEKNNEPTGPPEASFIINKSLAEIKDTIIFTNTSLNAQGYTWDFGDGNTSTEINPYHTYQEFGLYTVQLITTGPFGVDTIVDHIDIYNIVPAKRLGVFVLGDDMESHFSKMENTQYFHLNVSYSDGSHFHLAYFDDIGIKFYVKNYSSTISNSDIPYAICVYDPFQGKTEQGISIGSVLSELEAIYGAPNEISEEGSYYYEESLGIEFWADETGMYIDQIYICEPSAN